MTFRDTDKRKNARNSANLRISSQGVESNGLVCVLERADKKSEGKVGFQQAMEEV